MHALNYFSFDRNSTTPLEHKFGSVRRRSKFVHTLNKFLIIVSQMQSDKRVSKLIDGEIYEKEIEKIHCRQNSFGVLVEKNEINDSDILNENDELDKLNGKFPPQIIAKAILSKSGFEYTFLSYISDDDAIENLIVFLSNIVDDFPPIRKKKNNFKPFNYTWSWPVYAWQAFNHIFYQDNESQSTKNPN